MIAHNRLLPILIIIALAASLTGFVAPAAAHRYRSTGDAAGLALTVVPGAYSILLAWSPVQGAESYLVQKMGSNPLVFYTLAQLGASAASYLVQDLNANQHYQLRVEARNQSGVLDFGNVEVYTMPYQFVLPVVVMSN